MFSNYEFSFVDQIIMLALNNKLMMFIWSLSWSFLLHIPACFFNFHSCPIGAGHKDIYS